MLLEGKGGQVIGLFQMSGDAGAMIAPVVLGAIADGYGFRPAFLTSAVLLLIAVAVSTKLSRDAKFASRAISIITFLTLVLTAKD